MLRRDSLVPEVAVDLVDPGEPADDEALEIQLRRDAQGEVEVQRVVVRPEGPGGRSPRERLHHRRLHLDEAAPVEEAADEGDDLRPDLEGAPGFRRDDEIDVTLPIFPLDIREAVPLVGKRAERLRQKIERGRLDGKLSRPRPEDRSRDTHVVAEIQLLEELPVARAKRVFLHVDLDALRAVGEVEKHRLSHLPDCEDAPRHAHQPPVFG